MRPDAFNPYRPPEADLTAEPGFQDPDELRPVPYEDRETEPRFWPRVWAMFALLFRDPRGLADRVPVTQGLAAPWTFMLLLCIPVFLLWLLIMGLFFAVGLFSAFGAARGGHTPPLWIFAAIPLALLAALPVLQFLGMLLAGLVNHACLWMWGGMKQGRDLIASIRLSGYFFAFFTLVSWIPLIGSVAMLAGPAVLGIGLARIHRTDTWRGVCAAYTPLLLCCCAYGLFLASVLALASFGR